nr:recombinase family protein [Bradyrhizobium retamae]
MTVPQCSKGARGALYLRVSTAREAEHDVSIPDQKRQGEAYCSARGYAIVETYVEPGASATNDRRPEFQRMIEAHANPHPSISSWFIRSAVSSATISSLSSMSASWRRTTSSSSPSRRRWAMT